MQLLLRNASTMNVDDEREVVEEVEAVRFSQRLRRMLFLVVVPILCMLIMITLLQRYLIYYPKKETLILPEDAGLPAGRVETVSTKTDDGLVLNGWLISADANSHDEDALPDEKSVDYALALYFSGNAANRLYRVSEATVLTDLDVDVAIFDYRGYGENGGSPSEEGLAADARAMWRHVLEESSVESSEQIVLVGESLGGGVATRLAAELCEAGTPPGGLILRSTFSSLVDAGAYHYPWLPVRLLLRDRYLSTERIDSVTCPVLVVHGARDQIVPVELGRRLFASAPEVSHLGLPKRFVELTNADHNDILFVARRTYQDAIRSFFDDVARARATSE